MNVNALQDALTLMDKDGSGCLPSDQFVRCLSQTHMKLSDREVQVLLEKMDKEKLNTVNYKDFLKFSYLCHMYINYSKLEYEMKQLDKENKGLITVE